MLIPISKKTIVLIPLGILLILISIMIYSHWPSASEQKKENFDELSSLKGGFQPSIEESSNDADQFSEQLNQDISFFSGQTDILKEDILRGWYQASEAEKKFGTPDTWVFVEAGENSKWVSPNVLSEVNLIDQRRYCEETAGKFIPSCFESTDAQCTFEKENQCECPSQTQWNKDQGCIMVNEKGSFVSLNSEELAQGFYLGGKNQKKLNTPASWKWVEAGKNSSWRQ